MKYNIEAVPEKIVPKINPAQLADPKISDLFSPIYKPFTFSVSFENFEEAVSLALSRTCTVPLETGGPIEDALVIPTLKQLWRACACFPLEVYPRIVDIPNEGIDLKSRAFIRAMRDYAKSIHRLTGKKSHSKSDTPSVNAWSKSSQSVTLVLKKGGQYYGLILLFNGQSKGQAILVDANPIASEAASMTSNMLSKRALTDSSIGSDAIKLSKMFLDGPVSYVHAVNCMNGALLPSQAYEHYLALQSNYTAEVLFICAMSEAYSRYNLYLGKSTRMAEHNYGDLPYAPTLASLMAVSLAHHGALMTQAMELDLCEEVRTSPEPKAPQWGFLSFVDSLKFSWLSPQSVPTSPQPEDCLTETERKRLALE